MPDPEGARTFNYSVVLQVEPAGSPATWRNGGSTRMLLVKTPDGWRFKSRVSAPGTGVPPSLPLPKVR